MLGTIAGDIIGSITITNLMTPRPKKILPPVYFLTGLIIMVALHYLLPGMIWLGSWTRWGLVLILVGSTFTLRAHNQFTRQGTTVKPFQISSALVTDGLFRYSRNPMYLGLVLVLIGAATFLGSLTPFLVPPVVVGLITSRFITIEEKMLGEKFGQAFVDYRARVRRWI